MLKRRRKNPVPLSRHAEIQQAAKLYENFSGHEAVVVDELKKPSIPNVLVAIGHIDGIMYSTIRDGKLEKYVHEFRSKSRPLFCVSPDGKNIILLGGAYDFTERGIIDRRK